MSNLAYILCMECSRWIPSDQVVIDHDPVDHVITNICTHCLYEMGAIDKKPGFNWAGCVIHETIAERGVRVAMERLNPMLVVERDRCPNCKDYLGCENFQQKHCDCCGQRLEWRVLE